MAKARKPVPPERSAAVPPSRPHPLTVAWLSDWTPVRRAVEWHWDGTAGVPAIGPAVSDAARLERACCRAWHETRGRKLVQALTRPGRRGANAAADKTLRLELLAGGRGLRRIARAMYPREWPEAARDKLRNRLRRWREK